MAQRRRNSTLLMAVTSLLVILLCSLFHTSHCVRNNSKKANGRGFNLRLIHIDSPDSPLYQPNGSDLDKVNRWVSMSYSRLKYLSEYTTLPSVKNDTHYVPEPEIVIRPKIVPQDWQFIVQIGIGEFDGEPSFKKEYLIFDTGSGTVWTQCEGCTSCFRQRDPYFPKSRSRTYEEYPCSMCPPDEGGPGQCDKGHCPASTGYEDGGSMKGVWATETFTFATDDPTQSISVSGITFACGVIMQNFHVEDRNPNNIVSGILGMNQSPVSLISQLGTKVGKKFSYCLQDFFNDREGYDPMLLRFGDDTLDHPDYPSTPIYSVPGRRGYYLELLDLSVQGHRLNLNPNLFALASDHTGGTIIDTGTTFTMLVPAAYDALKNALTAYIANKNPSVRKANPPAAFLEDCWDVGGSSDPEFPSVTFHFGDSADFEVENFELIHVFAAPGNPEGVYCLAVMRSTNQVNIIGALQQINHRIVMDLANSQVRFYNADCSSGN